MRDSNTFVLEGRFKDEFSGAINTALGNVSKNIVDSEKKLFNSLAGNFKKYQGTVENAAKELGRLLDKEELSESDKIDLLGYFYKLDVDEEKGLLDKAQKELTSRVRKMFDIGELEPSQLFRTMQVELQNVLDDMKKDFAKGIEETDEFNNEIKKLQDSVSEFYNKNKDKDKDFFTFDNKEVVEFYKNLNSLYALEERFGREFADETGIDFSSIEDILDFLPKADQYADEANDSINDFVNNITKLRQINLIREIDPGYFSELVNSSEIKNAKSEVESLHDEVDRLNSELYSTYERISKHNSEGKFTNELSDELSEAIRKSEELKSALREIEELKSFNESERAYSYDLTEQIEEFKAKIRELTSENKRLQESANGILNGEALDSNFEGSNSLNILENISEELRNIRKLLGEVDDDNGFKNIIQSLKETLELINEINPKVGTGVNNVSLSLGGGDTNLKKAEVESEKIWEKRYSDYVKTYEKMISAMMDSMSSTTEYQAQDLLIAKLQSFMPNDLEYAESLSLNKIKSLPDVKDRVRALVEALNLFKQIDFSGLNITGTKNDIAKVAKNISVARNFKTISNAANKPLREMSNDNISDQMGDLLEDAIKSEQEAEEWKQTLVEINNVLGEIATTLNTIADNKSITLPFENISSLLDEISNKINDAFTNISTLYSYKDVEVSGSNTTQNNYTSKHYNTNVDLSTEISDFTDLENKIGVDVVNAIKKKNEALKEEKSLVHDIVESELEDFDKLEQKIENGISNNNVISDESDISSNDVLPQIEKINDEFENLGNGVKRVLSDIGLTYEQLIEKLRKENEEIEAGNRLFGERITYLKDGKVVDSFQGDEKGVIGSTGKDYDKIVHTHPSNARSSNHFSYDDIRSFYDNKMDMPSFAEAELFSEGDIKVVLQIGELTNSYMDKFRKLYQGLRESISIAFGKETDYGHFVPDETINNELVSAYFNSIAKNMINNLGGDLKFNLDDNNIDDKLKNKIIDIANEFVKDIADLSNHIENNISEEDYTKLVDDIYHEKFNKYRDFRNETPASTDVNSLKQQAEVLDDIAESAQNATKAQDEFAESNENVEKSKKGNKNISSTYDKEIALLKERNKLEQEVAKNPDASIINASKNERIDDIDKQINSLREQRIKLNQEDANQQEIINELLDEQKYKLKDINAQLLQREVDTLNSNSNTWINKIDKSLDSDKYTESYKKSLKLIKEEILSFQNSLGQTDGSNIDELRYKFDNLSKSMHQAIVTEDKDIVASIEQINKIGVRINKFANQNSEAMKTFGGEIRNLQERWNQLKFSGNIEADRGALKKLTEDFLDLERRINASGKTGDSFFVGLGKRIRSVTQSAIAMSFSFYDIIRYARETVAVVTELDSALTELRKVSDASTERLSQSFEKSADTAKELGSTISDVINATSDWSRMGWPLKPDLLYGNI